LNRFERVLEAKKTEEEEEEEEEENITDEVGAQ
jgi:hypothetical protein